jgi:BirA family biotin operon repressor/biotin-[acetyl-CoA-carboxylase] ligase
VTWYEEVDSTNDVALALASSGAEEGLVVAAGMQRRGRGRRGRSWSSPAGAGVYASVLLRPSARALPLLTIAAGVGLGEGIQASTGLETAVKWPNDICIDGPSGDRLKLAGILAEAGVSQDAPHVILGFGINVGLALHPPEIARRATSIQSELGRPVDRGLVLVECLAAVWRRYRDLDEERASSVLDAWRDRARSTFGSRVEWDGEGGVFSGVAVALDDGGALIVRTGSGRERVISGDVRWV